MQLPLFERGSDLQKSLQKGILATRQDMNLEGTN